ncbi:hypothetical protein DPMN_031157 [Dreissena polymorpha]|uniref:Uncharacterized protein n=1 Tax=Dreissena polymorpha TaxID=45954 RepID=A0A9D4RJ11_DREPO|nr:hypothetical protein DPMN_031157 [Dreissena polymorpha]
MLDCSARRATNNVTLMFALFEDPEEILKAMPKKIGIECAGKSLNMFRTCELLKVHYLSVYRS